MAHVKYTGPAQISERRIAQDELGYDVNEDGSSDFFVWNEENDFTVVMNAEAAEMLMAKAGGFSIVDAPAHLEEVDEGPKPQPEQTKLKRKKKEEDQAEDADSSNDDQASDPEGPSS
jgi:hypothetical protein